MESPFSIPPTYLTFPKHVDDLSQVLPSGLERKEAHPWLNKPFYEAMVLLHEIIEILSLP